MRAEEHLIQICRNKGLTLGAAESCSGGAFSARITQVPGASDVFLGAIVSYSNAIKQQVLGVPKESLILAGPVSKAVSQEMLKGALRVLGCTLAASITGIAGPTGGTAAAPIGRVWITVGGRDLPTKTEQLDLKGSRLEIIQQCVDNALQQLIQLVETA